MPGDRNVSLLHDMTFHGQSLDFLELRLKRFRRNVFSVSVFHPIDAKQVAQAGLHLLSHDLWEIHLMRHGVLLRAVGAPG